MALDWFPLVRPVLHALDAETAHRLTLRALASGLVPRPPQLDDPVLHTSLFGYRLPNPIGIAAGFDKMAEAWQALFGLGFGFVEVGGVTPLPQVGNPRPRLFRLPEDHAVINRMGFNNEGLAGLSRRLPPSRPPEQLVGINLAANGDSADPAQDFLTLTEALAPRAGFLTIDISCPNTANGKMFLEPGPLDQLLARVRQIVPVGSGGPAILAKSGPDVEPARLQEIVEVVLTHRLDGMIVCNTTVERPTTLVSRHREERGGLSGRPLFGPSTRMLGAVRRQAGDRLTLIGVGGVASGADAYAKIRAGASAVQLYTALVYHGPHLIHRIQQDLAQRLRADGYLSVAEAVGSGVAEVVG
ncbi:MAG: quinone-dependent dihydroorotate dehydrogenase [Alphaproteobacteria bacterium]|nr:quinone-dependent dihydroorotate dehydrogenase [Alphaproteobacteria bacterium]